MFQADTIVDISNASFSYGADSFMLGPLSFSLKQGEILGIVGANGSGKTTLLRCLAGLYAFKSGNFSFFGQKHSAKSFHSVHPEIGFVMHNPHEQLFSPTVEEEVSFGPLNYGIKGSELKERIDFALDAVNLKGFEKKKIHNLSEGQAKRIAMACVLSMMPQMLVCDEPLYGLDSPTGHKLASIIKQQIKDESSPVQSAIIVSHNLSLIFSLCDRVILLDEGKIVMDKDVNEIVSSNDFFEKSGFVKPLHIMVGKGLGLEPSLYRDEESLSQYLEENNLCVQHSGEGNGN